MRLAIQCSNKGSAAFGKWRTSNEEADTNSEREKSTKHAPRLGAGATTAPTTIRTRGGIAVSTVGTTRETKGEPRSKLLTAGHVIFASETEKSETSRATGMNAAIRTNLKPTDRTSFIA